MDKKAIGLRISTIRKELGLTQKELAEKLHVSDKSVSKWETGTHFPDIAIMEDLAAALDISAAELLGLEHATPEKTIDAISQISLEEKNEIKKEIRFRAKLTIVSVVILVFSELYLYFKLHQAGLNDAVYRSLTIGLFGIIGTILGSALFNLEHTKKL